VGTEKEGSHRRERRSEGGGKETTEENATDDEQMRKVDFSCKKTKKQAELIRGNTMKNRKTDEGEIKTTFD